MYAYNLLGVRIANCAIKQVSLKSRLDHFEFWNSQGGVRHSALWEDLRSPGWFCTVSCLAKNAWKGQAAGTDRCRGSSANRPGQPSGRGRPSSLPFSQGSWENFQRVSLRIWAMGIIPGSRCSPPSPRPMSVLETHLSLPPSLHAQLDHCFSNSWMFLTGKKDILYHYPVHTHTHTTKVC